jgi:hypothetical protein
MATDDPIRASDADRDTVVATLRDAYTVGRLTLDEFDERMAAAYAGKTWGDLRLLTIDLPSQPILGTDVPGRQLPAAAGLPSHPPRPVPDPGAGPQPPDTQRRGRPLAILIPVAVWVLLVAHGTIVGSGIIFVIVVIFVLTTIVSSIRRR